MPMCWDFSHRASPTSDTWNGPARDLFLSKASHKYFLWIHILYNINKPKTNENFKNSLTEK